MGESAADRERVRCEIITAIGAELGRSAESIHFVVEHREREGEVWKLYVDLTEQRSSGLDESLEGTNAWWPGPPDGAETKGGGDVLSVIPEEQQINIRFATSAPPGPGRFFLVYPHRYLESLSAIWSDAKWVERCLDWLDHVCENNSHDPLKTPNPKPFGNLRDRQKAAFSLPGWDAGYLWGPPGTGKTYTLGAILAQYLIQFPQAKVLLLSTTNSAVDQAMVAVDMALERLAKHQPAANAVRRRCVRVGNHFVAKNYAGREHLLPVRDERLVARLVQAESQRPDPANVQAYNNWKLLVEQFRRAMREQAKDVLSSARLAALTTTRAIFNIEQVRDLAPFDLIVFDEASQVSIPHALAIAPLGRHVLFAGDPNQLAPIVQSDHPHAQTWLGDSMFRYMDRSSPSTCLLNEQSRMAEPICRIISNVFYDKQLVVAKDCCNDSRWHHERQLPAVHPMGTSHVHLEMLEQNGQWSQNYHGPIRQPGAVFVCDVVDRLVTSGLAEENIIVLTPFRAQRALTRQKLRQAGFRHVTVSTVHRSQGSERHTVIFDPTLGDNEFMRRPDARRLVNVALSRAKARLIMILSPGDKANPLFEQIANVMRPAQPPPPARDVVEVESLVHRPDFPHCAVGRTIRSGKLVGRVTEVTEDGLALHLFDFDAGLTRRILVQFLLDKYGAKRQAGADHYVKPYHLCGPSADPVETGAGLRLAVDGINFCILGAVPIMQMRRQMAARIQGRIKLQTTRGDLFLKADQLRNHKPVPVLLYDAPEQTRVNIGWPVRWLGWYCGKANLTAREVEVEDLIELPPEKQHRLSSLTRHDQQNCTPMGPALVLLPAWLKAETPDDGEKDKG